MVLAWLLGVIASATAGDEITTEKPSPTTIWGVVIGIEEYPGLRNLVHRRFARNDAHLLYDLLVLKECAVAPKTRVRLLTDDPDSHPNAGLATVDSIREALRDVARRAGPEDLLLVYIKGAGIPSGAEFRWLCRDSNIQNLDGTTISLGELRQLFDAIPCRWKISLVDACFESPAVAMKLSARLSDANWPRLFRGLLGDHCHVLSANDGRRPSPVDPKDQHGLFARTLASALRGDADGAATDVGGEPDAWVSTTELWEFVRTRMPRRAVELAGNDANATPKLFGDAPLPYLLLARHPAARAEVERTLTLLEERRTADQLESTVHDDGVRLLEAMPPSADERRLRSVYLEYLAGTRTVAQLRAARDRFLSDRRLVPLAAESFARQVMDVRRRIDERYLEAGKGAQAVAASIRRLFDDAQEPVPPKLAEQLRAIDRMTDEDLEDLLARARERLGRRDGLTAPRDLERSLAAMLGSLDPYSRYLSPARYRQMTVHNNGRFAGIGVKVRHEPEAKSLLVVTALPDSPALKAGVEAGDRILAIDGEPVENLEGADVDQLFTGRRNEPVELLIEREGSPQPISVTVRRDVVKVESVVGTRRMADGAWDYWLDRKARIGYVRLTTFASDTAAEDLRKVVQQLRRQDGLSALALDLRFNPGGVLASAIDVADLFLDRGPIVTIRYRTGKPETTYASRAWTYRDIPLVVLINRESASGSEIVAAAIADHRRGRVIGERSFGKGTVQNIEELPDNAGALKLTTATYHRPDGERNLHRFPGATPEDDWGVRPDPDYEIPLARDRLAKLRRDLEEREVIGGAVRKPGAAPESDDPQLRAALDYLRRRVLEARKAG